MTTATRRRRRAGRGELGMLPVNLVLGGLAALVAWGRFKKAPVAPRG